MSKPLPFVRPWLWALLLLAAALPLRAAETIPAEPTRFFNDYALAVKPGTADKLNAELEQLEQQSSNQILVAIYPKMQSDSDVSDYCLRVFRAWKVGQKDKNNGAVLFVFLQDHKLWIQTGRGIEGALPDATCKDITADVIAPKMKAGDVDGAMTAGVNAMIAASKGEYKGTGTTDYQRQHQNDNAGGGSAGGLGLGTIFFLIVAFLIIRSIFGRGGRGGGGTMFGGGGPIFFPGGGFGGGFGGGGGGGFGGGGGGGFGGGGGGDSGGFSAGGGDTGGGGAGSSW